MGLPELFDPPERAEPPPQAPPAAPPAPAPAPPPVEDWQDTAAPTAYPAAAPDDLPIIEPRAKVVRTVDKAPPIVSAIVVAIALAAVAIAGTLLRGGSAENTKPRPPAAAAPAAAKTKKPTATHTVSPLVRGVIVRAQRGPVSLSAKLPNGALLFSGVLPQGTYKRFEVPKVVVLIGDAGAADIYVNGVRRPRLGPAGRFIQLTVTAPI